MAKTDQEAALIAELNGACKPHIIAGINGNLPPQWSCASVRAMPSFGDPPIAVFAEAEAVSEAGRPCGRAGAKLLIDAPHDHLRLADELARQLCETIRKLGPPRVRFALDPGAIMPTRGSAGASGYDLYSPIDVMIRARSRSMIDLGLRLELPGEDWCAYVCPRSGMSARGLWVQLGVVDHDYRGPIAAIAANMTDDDAQIKTGDRVAQLILSRICHPDIEMVDVAELSPTIRGTSGFGSSGL